MNIQTILIAERADLLQLIETDDLGVLRDLDRREDLISHPQTASATKPVSMGFGQKHR
ncbi:MAG: hypothetical protein WBG92_15435 [Thiohalocapsa sp.]